MSFLSSFPICHAPPPAPTPTLGQSLGPNARGMAARTMGLDVQSVSIIHHVSEKALQHMRKLEEANQRIEEQQEELRTHKRRLEELEKRADSYDERLSAQNTRLSHAQTCLAKTARAAKRHQTTLDRFAMAFQPPTAAVTGGLNADDDEDDLADLDLDLLEASARVNTAESPLPRSASIVINGDIKMLECNIDELSAAELARLRAEAVECCTRDRKVRNNFRGRVSSRTQQAFVYLETHVKRIQAGRAEQGMIVFENPVSDSTEITKMLHRFRAEVLTNNASAAVKYRDHVLGKLGLRLTCLQSRNRFRVVPCQ